MNYALTSPSGSHKMRSIFVVGVDDVHPESLSNGCDCGGDLERGALVLLSNFLEKHPQVKITLFVTPNWRLAAMQELSFLRHELAVFGKSKSFQTPIRRAFKRRFEHNTYLISRKGNSKWCKYLEELVTQGRIGIGVHGLYHFQNFPPFSAEFMRLGRREARKRLKRAKDLFAQANLSCEKGFAPPGWAVNEATLQALVDEDFRYVAGSADGRTEISRGALSKGAGLLNVPLLRPCPVLRKLINVPRNCGIENNNLKRIRDIVKNNGLISFHCHIENEYHGHILGNGVTQENTSNLEEVVCHLENEHPDEVWYATFGEVASQFIESQWGPRRN